MLVISRKIRQSIIINQGQIIIKVLTINESRGQVRIGIEAPPEISVDREEVRLSKKADKNLDAN